MIENILRSLAKNEDLLEIGRKAIECNLTEYRDARLSEFRENGFNIKEVDGSPSNIIRFGTQAGLIIALNAIADYLEKEDSK